jgi:hypothetical protein
MVRGKAVLGAKVALAVAAPKRQLLLTAANPALQPVLLRIPEIKGKCRRPRHLWLRVELFLHTPPMDVLKRTGCSFYPVKE